MYIDVIRKGKMFLGCLRMPNGETVYITPKDYPKATEAQRAAREYAKENGVRLTSKIMD